MFLTQEFFQARSMESILFMTSLKLSTSHLPYPSDPDIVLSARISYAFKQKTAPLRPWGKQASFLSFWTKNKRNLYK